MKSSMSSGLLAFLRSKVPKHKADLFALNLVPQNLLTRSQDFEFSAWLKAANGGSGPPVVTPDFTTDPIGGNTADKIVFPSGSTPEIFQIVTMPFTTGLTFTLSVWLRTDTTGNINLQFSDYNGSTATENFSQNIALTATWQRFSLTGTFGAGTNAAITVFLDTTAAVNVYAWGMQLESGNVVSPYVATVAEQVGPPLLRPSPILTASATSQDLRDVSYNGMMFYATKFGNWERGTITAEAAFDLRSNDMKLTGIVNPSILFPNSDVTMQAAALMGLFDAVTVNVWTIYWPVNQPAQGYVNSWGAETKYAGIIKPGGQITRSKIEFDVADFLYRLNMKMPRNIIQTPCRHTLFDNDEFAIYGTRSNCTLLPANFKSGITTVAVGSTTQNIITTSALPLAPPRFTQGYITFITGFNAGYTFYIKQQNSTTNFLLGRSVPLPLAIGDQFIAFQGCDKQESTCNTVFSNLIHFGGQPFVPNPEVAI